MRTLITLAISVSVVAACGGSEPAATSTDTPSQMTVPTGEGVPLCEDLGWFTGPEELYGASPIYVGNEMPIEVVKSYAAGMDGFVQAWIDREHNGWVNVGFKGVDVAEAQEELDASFPDEGVVAVALPHTTEELEAIRRQVAAAMPDDFDASNFHELHGRVEVWVGRLTNENIARVEELVGDQPVCVMGADPESTPEPGPQPAGGDGWTYVGEFDVPLGGRTVVVVGAPGPHAQLWSGLGGGAEPPEVDFDEMIVAAVEMGYSGSCPETRLDAVTIEGSDVSLVINTITEDMACTDDYNPRVYVVALEREALPAPPFTLGRADAPALDGQIQEDLRVPGSEPGPLGPAPEPEPEARLPEVIEPGFPWEAVIDVSCGIELLGEVNGVHWRTEQGLPPEWEDFRDGDLLAVTLLLEEGPEPTLTVTAGNHGVVYVPGEPDPEPCPDEAS